MTDLLAGATWSCAHERQPDAPPASPAPDLAWTPARVPGTTAGALLDAGEEVALLHDHDAGTWWFRTHFDGPDEAAPHLLGLDGLATLADVWVDGEHVLHSENMFLAHEVALSPSPGRHELLLRFASVTRHVEQMGRRRPRARWRTVRLTHQNLRWVRTTALGRVSGRVATAAPVGPWRPVRLLPVPALVVRRRRLEAELLTAGDGHAGRVRVDVELGGAPTPAGGRLWPEEVLVEVTHEGRVVASASYPVQTRGEPGDPGDGGDRGLVRADLSVDAVEPWWPHTHGDQPLYAVRLVVPSGDDDGEPVRHELGRVGFRTVEVDRTDGGFRLVVNGVPVFARGTSWTPPDPDRLDDDPERLQVNVRLLREAHHNLVRVPGNTVYPSAAFLDLLDEEGILLWQDAMVAYVDLPDDDALLGSTAAEVTQVLEGLQGRPCLAVVCGGADTEEQGEYQGVALDSLPTRWSAEVLPGLVEQLVPGCPYLTSTPGDSDLPTRVDRGVSHYFGVGPYLLPPQDARRAGVRFAAECLPFATPLEPLSAAARAHGERGLGRAPDPRAAVHRDHGQVLWDVEDTRDHYTAVLFGRDVLRLRQEDPELAEQLFAATVVELFEQTFSEWRRPGSTCAGALTFYGHDLRLGPGLGLVDLLDRPKAGWFAMRQVLAPVGLLCTDEGFSGVALHAVNETASPVEAHLQVDLYAGTTLLESVRRPVHLPARGSATTSSTDLFPGFRDLTWVHRFGEPAADVLLATLVGPDGEQLAHAFHLPGGPGRPREDDVGLRGEVRLDGDRWTCEVGTTRFAQRVHLDVPGWTPQDSWFHLAPGQTRRVELRPETWTHEVPRAPTGRVAAINSRRTALLRRSVDG